MIDITPDMGDGLLDKTLAIPSRRMENKLCHIILQDDIIYDMEEEKYMSPGEACKLLGISSKIT